MDHLESLYIEALNSKSWIANELLDVLTCSDLTEQGLNKLILKRINNKCEPFEEDVMIRLAYMCPSISYLQLSEMTELSEVGKLSIASLFRQII